MRFGIAEDSAIDKRNGAAEMNGIQKREHRGSGMKSSPTAYMKPETARALLELSRRRTTALRLKRELYQQARRIGWTHSAAMELAEIGAKQ